VLVALFVAPASPRRAGLSCGGALEARPHVLSGAAALVAVMALGTIGRAASGRATAGPTRRPGLLRFRLRRAAVQACWCRSVAGRSPARPCAGGSRDRRPDVVVATDRARARRSTIRDRRADQGAAGDPRWFMRRDAAFKAVCAARAAPRLYRLDPPRLQYGDARRSHRAAVLVAGDV
jgi:hypothetical protein